jgi:inhibitor of KinA
MKVESLGESAFLLSHLPVPAYRIATVLNLDPPPGLVEAIASYDTVGLYVDQDNFDQKSVLRDWHFLEEAPASRTHTIPVCYRLGPDLEEVCEHLAIAPQTLVEAHTAAPFQCFAIGFCPGFPYLGYLPDVLAGVPRLGKPRTNVEPGMVGITGRQTGIYPLPRPGGWRLIGRTPLQLVDLEEDYFPIMAGDRVQFESIEESTYERLKGDRLAV